MTVKELKNILDHVDENAEILVVRTERQSDGFDKLHNYDLNQVMSVTANINKVGGGKSMVCFMIK